MKLFLKIKLVRVGDSMSKKVNVYKTIEKVINNIDFGVRYAGIAGIHGEKSCYDIFHEENEELLDDFESEDFKKVIDDALNNGGIYLALFSGNDESDYGIIVDKNLDTGFAQRFYGNFASGQLYERILIGTDVIDLINILMKYIIYD